MEELFGEGGIGGDGVSVEGGDVLEGEFVFFKEGVEFFGIEGDVVLVDFVNEVVGGFGSEACGAIFFVGFEEFIFNFFEGFGVVFFLRDEVGVGVVEVF